MNGIRELPIVEMLGKKWYVDERLKQFRSVANFPEPIIFLNFDQMDILLNINEIISNPEEFGIDIRNPKNKETITEFSNLLNKGLNGDLEAINDLYSAIEKGNE